MCLRLHHSSRYMKVLYYFLGLTVSFCLILVLLVTSIEAVLYWSPGYFEKEYQKYQVTEQIDMEMEDLLYVSDVMMDYLKGGRESLQVSTMVHGTWRTFFSQRELDHMTDVKNLFLGGFALRRRCLLIAAAGVVLLYLLKGRLTSVLPRAMCAATGIFFSGICLLAAIIATDFTKYFTVFHEIFFDNDLWLLNPKRDLLINVVPEPFFVDTAARIAVVFGVSLLLILAGCLLCLYRGRRTKVSRDRAMGAAV